MTSRILIVEDEAVVAMELRFLLEDLGHQVAGTAIDSSTALSLASEIQFDLALVDIHLSDGPTGIELAKRLGEDMGVSVVFLTGNPGMVRGGVKGALGVLSKPADEEAVEKAIAYALQCRSGEPVDYPPPGLRLFN